MIRSVQWRVVLAAMVLGGTLAACTGLAPPAADEISIYVFDVRPAMDGLPPQPGAVLAVGPPRAWPGFDTPRMAYVRQPHELEYFTKSRWADAPARMLAPLLVRALGQSGAFGAVVHNPGAVAGTLRLDTELVRLQQEFQSPQSRVRVTLRAQLIDMQERRVIGAREFEEVEMAAAENAYAGVAALNRALERLLPRLAEFCASAAASR
jgi:cholesterol transport system auxiliary component